MGEIATQQVAADIGGSSATTPTECCTEDVAISLNCDVDGEYGENELVMVKDLSIGKFYGSFKVTTIKNGEFTIQVTTSAESYDVDFGDGNWVHYDNLDGSSVYLTTNYTDDSEKEVTVKINKYSEIDYSWNISAKAQEITSVEFTDFLNLKNSSIGHNFNDNKITHLDFKGYGGLIEATNLNNNFDNNELEVLHFTGFENLIKCGSLTQSFNNNKLTDIYLTDYTNLLDVDYYTINLKYNNFVEFNLDINATNTEDLKLDIAYNSNLEVLNIDALYDLVNLKILYLDFDNCNINTFDTTALQNLQSLNTLRLGGYLNNITTLSLEYLSSLQLLINATIVFDDNNIDELDLYSVSDLVNLKKLHLTFANNKIPNIDLTPLNNLNLSSLYLSVVNNLITSIDLSTFPDMIVGDLSLLLDNEGVTEIDLDPLGVFTDLTVLALGLANGVTFNSVDLSFISNLTKLTRVVIDLSTTGIPNIDFSPLSYLNTHNCLINLNNSLVETLDLSVAKNVNKIEVRRSQLTYLDISNTSISDINQEYDENYNYNSLRGLTGLKDFICKNNSSIKTIDLDSNAGLTNIDIENNESLQTVTYPSDWSGSTDWS